jgi:hypothetical protein
MEKINLLFVIEREISLDPQDSIYQMVFENTLPPLEAYSFLPPGNYLYIIK